MDTSHPIPHNQSFRAERVRNHPGVAAVFGAAMSSSSSTNDLMKLVASPNGQLAAVAYQDDYGMRLLHWVCSKSRDDLAVIQAVGDACPEAVRCQNEDGEVPLHLVCRHSSGPAMMSVVRYLLELWPEATRVENDAGYLPLHYACRSTTSTLPLVKALVEAWPGSVHHSSKNNPKLAQPWCSWIATANRHWPDMLDFMLQYDDCLSLEGSMAIIGNKNKKNMFHGLVTASDIDAMDVRTVHARFPKHVQLPDVQGNLPLHLYLQHNGPKAAETVVSQLIRLFPMAAQTLNRNGQVPLAVACRHNCARDVLTVLVDAFPRGMQRASCNNGDLPLHEQCRHPKAAAQNVQFVMKKYKDALVASNARGWLPIHLACRHSSSSTIRFLAQARPQLVRAPLQRDGRLPLHLVACRQEFSDVGVVKFLLELHPQAIQQPCGAGNWPLHAACASRADPKLIRYLYKQSPVGTLQTRNRAGFAPFQLAAMSSSTLDVIFHLVRSEPEAVRCSPAQAP